MDQLGDIARGVGQNIGRASKVRRVKGRDLPGRRIKENRHRPREAGRACQRARGAPEDGVRGARDDV